MRNLVLSLAILLLSCYSPSSLLHCALVSISCYFAVFTIPCHSPLSLDLAMSSLFPPLWTLPDASGYFLSLAYNKDLPPNNESVISAVSLLCCLKYTNVISNLQGTLGLQCSKVHFLLRLPYVNRS